MGTASEDEKTQDIKAVPTINYFHKTYGITTEGNDQKAIRVFKEYESKEKLRRLQQELMWLKNERVTEAVCDAIIGKKRSARYGSYKRWAELMLLWIVSK